ncbi:MAG: Sec-independent protein translocase protein TatB [Alphaproteobacteria bacterium]|nr:Sec-independent protein translocase protein TatB [Alphaproteobacteria bacterium]
MFDIGWTEMAIVVVIAILVVGPKDLPKVLRTVRAWIAKARSLAREFQDGVDDLVREAELKELRAEVEDAAKDQLSGEFDDLIDPTADIMNDDPALDAKPKPAAQTDKSKPSAPAAEPAEPTIHKAEPAQADSSAGPAADDGGGKPEDRPADTADTAAASNR